MNTDIIPVFVGYDPREAIAYHVCVNSIIRNCSRPVSLIPLSLGVLRDIYTEQHQDNSNDFVYTRFLVPWLMNFKGRAIFIDGDMIVRGDISELWDMTHDADQDVHVVKHDYKTKLANKYLGAKNLDYPRKNWSSVVVWNCASPEHQILTPQFVAQQPGSYLHRFSWLADHRIGALPLSWNWLPDEFGANQEAKILHWTLGTPCFAEFASADQSEEWHREHARTLHCGKQLPA